MRTPKIRGKGPEHIIQDALIEFLELRGWHVIVTNGNMFQQGLPDLYATHPKWGERWIEVKNPLAYKFTPAQLEHFPFIPKVWILVAASQREYEKLWADPNWRHYLK